MSGNIDVITAADINRFLTGLDGLGPGTLGRETGFGNADYVRPLDLNAWIIGPGGL